MPDAENHDKILDIVVAKDEVTWQSMITELVKQEGMNPWDVDVSRLSARYIEMLKKMKELDFRVSGKVVLASAILLKLKSQKLLSDDINELDKLMAPPEEMSEEEFYDGIDDFTGVSFENPDIPPLMPRTPQPRKRKVSIYDLMLALNKALEVRDRRVIRHMPRVKMEVPERKVDLMKLMDVVYDQLSRHWQTTTKTMTYQEFVKDEAEHKKRMHTFLSLLHLANIDHRKIDLSQKEDFGTIEIHRANPDQEALRAMQAELAEKKNDDASKDE